MREMETRTVQVGNISDLAGEREIREFFSFSGEIECVEIRGEVGSKRIAFVTFKDPRALEIALLLSGATIVDQLVSILPAENYTPIIEEVNVIEEVVIHDRTSSASDSDCAPTVEEKGNPSGGRAYASKAHDVMSNMFAKSSALRQDAINKAKAFDEKHQLRASASAKVLSFDKRVGLSEKITVGISVVNEKVKSVDQRLHVSDRTMSALFVAEQKLNNTGTAVKTNSLMYMVTCRDDTIDRIALADFAQIPFMIISYSSFLLLKTLTCCRCHNLVIRYVTAGTAWLSGAFGKVAKVGNVASTKTREKFQMAVSNLTAKDPIVAA